MAARVTAGETGPLPAAKQVRWEALGGRQRTVPGTFLVFAHGQQPVPCLRVCSILTVPSLPADPPWLLLFPLQAPVILNVFIWECFPMSSALLYTREEESLKDEMKYSPPLSHFLFAARLGDC